jgi:Fe-Mn family superoxide dismutase
MNASLETRPAGMTMEPAMALALAANFGSVGRWREQFATMAKAHCAGRVALAFQPSEGTLVNQGEVELTGASTESVPILTVDLSLHPGENDATDLIDRFIESIDWGDVYERYRHAVHATSESLAATHEEIGGAVVIDVRRAGVYEQAATMIPGAHWRDPSRVADWWAELPADREVIVYCVYGHEVGRATALRLRASGLKARFLRGGIDGWQSTGQTLEPKGDRS